MSDWTSGGTLLSREGYGPRFKRRMPKIAKRIAARRSLARRRTRIPRSLRSKAIAANSCITVKRSQLTTLSVTYNAIASASTTAYDWTLSGIPGYTEFTNLFDQYRIRKIVMKFVPRFNSFSFADYTSTSTEVPSWVSAIDLDDSTPPTDADELMQYATVKYHVWNRPFTRVIYPRTATAMYSGAFTSYGSTPSKQWIDCASTGVKYYGLKLATTTYSSANSGEAPSWDIIIDYYVQFRGMR